MEAIERTFSYSPFDFLFPWHMYIGGKADQGGGRIESDASPWVLECVPKLIEDGGKLHLGPPPGGLDDGETQGDPHGPLQHAQQDSSKKPNGLWRALPVSAGML